MRERVLAAGVAALIFASACAPDPDDPYEAPSPVVNAPPSGPGQTTQTPAPAPAATPAPVPQAPAPTSAPTAAPNAGAVNPTQPVATPGQQPSPTATANPEGSPIAQPGSPVTPQSSPTTGTGTAMPGTGAAPVPSFNAGSGVLQPDGKTVVYRIPDGTGGNDWNDKTKPIRVQRGMTLRLIDEDKSTAAGGHWLHTYGQPCMHGNKAIGTGFDCKINQNAPMGLVSGVAEHNIFNGIGYLWIEVVAN